MGGGGAWRETGRGGGGAEGGCGGEGVLRDVPGWFRVRAVMLGDRRAGGSSAVCIRRWTICVAIIREVHGGVRCDAIPEQCVREVVW